VFEGDQPTEVAERFCKEHGLDGKKKSKLVDAIQKQLKNMLPKIDEELE